MSDLKIYLIATVNETVWYCWTAAHIDLWNRKDNPEAEVDLHKYAQLIFDERVK